jgi:ceramide glucosyltransferase
VRVAHAAGSRRFGFGATLALRRATLSEIGGFDALKNCLADDYWLAEHVRLLGLRTVLSPVIVATDVIEPTLGALWQRETRWLRTIRSINPIGFAFLFITFTSLWVLMGGALAWALSSGACGGHPVAAGVLTLSTASSCVARLSLHWRTARHAGSFWRNVPLVPLRDMVLALQWMVSVFGSHVVWRGARMPIAPQGASANTGAIGELRTMKTMQTMNTSDGA